MPEQRIRQLLECTKPIPCTHPYRLHAYDSNWSAQTHTISTHRKVIGTVIVPCIGQLLEAVNEGYKPIPVPRLLECTNPYRVQTNTGPTHRTAMECTNPYQFHA
ncbi:hypothetical protein DPMN_048076 [Dreissena polymorpha]|uniref:Uncharacterized protein n=1 Tax=Dreissena polymorpha TaxID=45954 RepID=A0A9D4DBL2_DREPO|nr:hypothetical protein DPMN_048076 [Dreissena polymorpha]